MRDAALGGLFVSGLTEALSLLAEWLKVSLPPQLKILVSALVSAGFTIVSASPVFPGHDLGAQVGNGIIVWALAKFTHDLGFSDAAKAAGGPTA